MCRRLILIKHSQPEIVPDVISHEWRLSETGRRRCRVLAGRLAAYGPQRFVSSTEPKAAETAAIVADLLRTPWEIEEGLQENDRSGFVFHSDEAYDASFREFFAHPDRRVVGRETADQAHLRFAAAMSRVLERHPSGTLGVVAHGTVITLFVSRATGLEPFPLWRRLGLPSFVVLSLPELAVQEIVGTVE
jgi:broad specificity phosphatase PhoE